MLVEGNRYWGMLTTSLRTGCWTVVLMRFRGMMCLTRRFEMRVLEA